MGSKNPEHWRLKKGHHWLPDGVRAPRDCRQTRYAELAFIEGFHDAAYGRDRLSDDPDFEALRGRKLTLAYERGYDAGVKWLYDDDS